MISAGELRYKATILRENNKNAFGKRDGTYSTTSDTFRCMLQDNGSSEVQYGDGVVVSKRYTLKARWKAIENILLETDRLSVNGHIFRVSGITNTGELDKVAYIECEEII